VQRPERIVVIGYGAIGRTLVREMARLPSVAELAGVITLPEFLAAAQNELLAPVFETVDEALATKPTLFVECGGHGALRAHACSVLQARIDLLVASVGALSDLALETEIRAAAEASGARVLLPAGAIGGLDALAAARRAGLDEVRYTSVKAPKAWRGTHAEKLLDLDQIQAFTEFFTGNARNAARLFPQNANVAAAVALAGVGFEATKVTLTVDPEATFNRHSVSAHGQFGAINVTIESRTLPENPKTSMLAPMSLLNAVASRNAAVRIA
jgi:aspartate dehydrogenase